MLLIVLLITGLLINTKQAAAAVNVSTSSASSATQTSFQRKTWYDGTYYWVAFHSGSDIQFWYSSNNSTWTQNTNATISVSTADFSIEADSTNAFIAYSSASSSASIISLSATSYPANNFSWSSNTTTFAGSSTVSYSYPVIKRDTTNNVMVLAQNCTAASGTCNGTSYFLQTRVSASANIVPSTSASAVTLTGSTSTSSNTFGALANIYPDGDMYAVYVSSTSIKSLRYHSGSWGPTTTVDTGLSGLSNSLQLVSIPINDAVYLTYINSSGNTVFSSFSETWSQLFAPTTDSSVNSLVYDGSSLYASTSPSSGNTGSVYRCTVSTGCSSANWIQILSASSGAFRKMIVANGKMFVGTTTTMYRCSATCSSGANWANYSLTWTPNAFAYDSTNNFLYAGTSSNGQVYRCDMTSLCDASTDWALAFDSADTVVGSMAYDITRGIIYAGTQTSGHLYTCDTSTDCSSSSNWSTFATTSDVYDMSYDSSTGDMYLAEGSTLIKRRTAAGSLFATYDSWTGGVSQSRSVLVDSATKAIFGGGVPPAVVKRMPTGIQTTLDATNGQKLNALGLDTTNGEVYAGSADITTSATAKIYKRKLTWQSQVILDSNSGNGYPTISRRKSGNNDIYVLWVQGSNINYKKGVYPYASGNWDANATALYNTGTNTWLSSAQVEGSGRIPVIWTEGTANPYNVKYDFLNFQTSPTTSLSTPSFGQTGINILPTFTLSASDTDSDYVRFEIMLYQSDCSTLVMDIDQTADQTGWSGQNAQSNTAYTSGTTATHTYQPSALAAGTQYCWKARAIDPAGTNIWGSFTSTQTFTTNNKPAAPTLSGVINIGSLVPRFELRTTDAESNYLQYKIELCSVSNCSSILRTIDQASDQTGWSGQNLQSGTAYTGSSSISNSKMAIHLLQDPPLASSTQYWWRAYAIDPGGSNTWSTASSISTFTTSPAEVRIMNNVNIMGGVTITP